MTTAISLVMILVLLLIVGTTSLLLVQHFRVLVP